MKNIFDKLKFYILNPSGFLNKLLVKFNKLFLKKITINGNVYYSYKGYIYPQYLNKGNAVSFIKNKALKYCVGKGLDIGAGSWPLPGAIPVRDEELLNAYKLDIFEDGSLDYVFSSHCIEHLKYWKKALKLWVKKIKKGGIIFIYAPHKSMKLWLPLSPWVGEDHKWSPDFLILKEFLEELGCEILSFEPERDIYWSFYLIAVKRYDRIF
ncbi:MAG: methyltransferase domain-containing protein [Elusimicrobiota bacterium]